MKTYEEFYSEKRIKGDIMTEVLKFIEQAVEDSVLLSQDFAFLELKKAIKSFKTGKTPGEDGLPLEFYMTF